VTESHRRLGTSNAITFYRNLSLYIWHPKMCSLHQHNKSCKACASLPEQLMNKRLPNRPQDEKPVTGGLILNRFVHFSNNTEAATEAAAEVATMRPMIAPPEIGGRVLRPRRRQEMTIGGKTDTNRPGIEVSTYFAADGHFFHVDLQITKCRYF
jgi:hypothetical protein